MQETRVRSLGQEDSLEEGMATHSSILPWKTPWIEEPGGLQSIGLERVEHEWSNLACSCCSVTKWCLTLCDPMDCSTTGSCPPLSPRVCSKSCPLSWWCYLTILSSDVPFSFWVVFPSTTDFSNELALPIRWPKYWSFSFSSNPSNEYSGLISFRVDWFDLPATG